MCREGDFIETIEGLIFDVKGLIHPPNRIIAYVRYIPDEKGERRRGDSRYRKVYSLKERENFLNREYPHYLIVDPIFNERISEVHIDHLTQQYTPQDTVNLLKRKERLDDVENEALEFLDLLVEASGISQRKMGIAGSIMVDLHLSTSDLDIIVYGTQNSFIVHKTLKECFGDENGLIRAYDLEGLRKLYSFRVKDTPMSFEDFYRHAIRKSSQGTFRDRDFSIRYLKDWEEVKEKYGTTRYRSLGQGIIKAKVIDDSEALFTPCRYLVEDVKSIEGKKVTLLKEVTSFRGRFCQHVKSGESIIARGKLECVKTEKDEYVRILIGGTAKDYIVSCRKDVGE
jgi:predicted nucleotidyltransferase